MIQKVKQTIKQGGNNTERNLSKDVPFWGENESTSVLPLLQQKDFPSANTF